MPIKFLKCNELIIQRQFFAPLKEHFNPLIMKKIPISLASTKKPRSIIRLNLTKKLKILHA